MKKTMYIQPSVEVSELMMVHTLCVSEPSGGGSLGIIPDGDTDEQL
jgi:hypothetical protein